MNFLNVLPKLSVLFPQYSQTKGTHIQISESEELTVCLQLYVVMYITE